jgi:iron complex transport system substrate-binding protein
MVILSRRSLLGIAASAVFPRRLMAAQPRLAIIDWGLLETAIAIGATPVAATELLQYRQIVVEPEVPDTVTDLGLRGSPNYELLRLVRPDLILLSQFYEYQRPMLERIAPVMALPIHEPGTPPYPLAEAAMLNLGEALGLADAARAYISATRAELEARHVQLARLAGRPVFVVSLGDSRHFRAFGHDSMFGDVLLRLGLRNAWTDPTSYSAAAPVGIEALAQVPEAAIVIVKPLPPEVGRTLPGNALWNALPAVLEGRVAILDPINHFGGLPSARRFARLLAEATVAWPAA